MYLHSFFNQYQIIQLQLSEYMLLLQSFRKLLNPTLHLCSRKLAYQVSVPQKKMNTQIFSDLTYAQIANPRLTKYLITKPLHMHSRVSQRSLFHRKRVSGIIRSCFSEKKHKVFRRVHKIKKEFYSDILQKNIFVTVSKKAQRTITKMGSFDNYILCTKPKNLDSTYGQYLRQLMLRKVNNSDFRIPYIIGTNRKLRIKSYRKQLYLNSLKKIIIPKQYKENMRTFQRKFGKTPQQLNNADYEKYLELENLKKTLGDQLEPTHPLLVELKQKMDKNFMTKQEQQRLKKMAKQAEQNFLNDPKNSETNRKRFEKILNLKLLEMRFKVVAAEEENNMSKKELIKAQEEKLQKDAKNAKQQKQKQKERDRKQKEKAKEKQKSSLKKKGNSK